MPWRILQLDGQFEHLVRDRLGVVGHLRRPVVALLDLLAPRVLLALRVTERAGDVAHRGLGAVGDDVGDLGRVLSSVQCVDVLDDLFAPVGLDVDVDVRWLAAFGCEEAFEHQPVEDRVDGGDAQRVADRGVGGRSPSLGEDSLLAAELRDLPHDEEVAGEVQLLDDLELVLDHLAGPLGVWRAGEHLGVAAVGQLAQVGHLVVPGRDGERRQVGRDQLERKGDLGADAVRGSDHPGPAGEPLGQLVAAAQMLRGRRRSGRQPAVDVVEAAAGTHRGERGGQRTPRRGVEVCGGGGDDLQPPVVGELVQRVVALVGERVEFVGQLDHHVVAPEPVDQLVQRPAGRTAGVELLPHRALAAPGEDQPVPVGRRGELVEVVDGSALRPAAQLGLADHPAQRGVTVRVAGEDEQVVTGRVGHTDPGRDQLLGLGARQRHVQPQLGAEAGGEADLLRRLGEADDAVHAVVIGEGERAQAEPGGLLGQLLG